MKTINLVATLLLLSSCQKDFVLPSASLNIRVRNGLNDSGYAVVGYPVNFRAESENNFDGTKYVQFFKNGVLVHTEYLVPFGWRWVPRYTGNYTITIKEVSKKDAVITSQIIIHVVDNHISPKYTN